MKLALLITTHNRTELLRNSLSRLTERTLPDEVLVVDDGGNDDCEAACVSYSDLLPIRYIYTHNPGETICSHARNVGIKATRCDYVLTSEPEMLFDTDVVAQMLANVPNHRYELINAGTVHHEQLPGSVCGCCGQAYHTTTNWSATWVALYRREWLLRIGGWDEDFPSSWGWDDVDLCTRLRVSGIGQFNDLGIEVTHQWHHSRACNQGPNEAHFRSKVSTSKEDPTHPDLVANRDREWGVPIPRP